MQDYFKFSYLLLNFRLSYRDDVLEEILSHFAILKFWDSVFSEIRVLVLRSKQVSSAFNR